MFDAGAGQLDDAAGSGRGPAASPGSTGPGVSAAATQTSANAPSRRIVPAVESGIGSPKTIGPEAIVTTLPTAVVMAMTATTGPSCSERALTTSPISERIRMARA